MQYFRPDSISIDQTNQPCKSELTETLQDSNTVFDCSDTLCLLYEHERSSRNHEMDTNRPKQKKLLTIIYREQTIPK